MEFQRNFFFLIRLELVALHAQSYQHERENSHELLQVNGWLLFCEISLSLSFPLACIIYGFRVVSLNISLVCVVDSLSFTCFVVCSVSR